MFSKQLEYLKCYNYWIKICFKHTQDFIFWLVGHKFKRCPWTTHVPVNYVSCVNWQELKEVIFSLLHPIPQYKSAWTQPKARRVWIILSKWAAYGAGIERSKIELCNLRKRPGVYLTVSQLSMCLRDFLGNFVLSIILTIPASTVTLERSFSCLWRVKTYLRSTMRAERLALYYASRKALWARVSTCVQGQEWSGRSAPGNRADWHLNSKFMYTKLPLALHFRMPR